MSHFEHATVVARTPEHVAAALAAPEAGPLFAPPIARVTLDERGGRAADLAYEQVWTEETGTVSRAGRGGDQPTIATGFAGPGVEGSLTYRLVPEDDATKLVQLIEYEFAEWATVDLLESETTVANDRQFAGRLHTVWDLLEAGSQLLPGGRALPVSSISCECGFRGNHSGV